MDEMPDFDTSRETPAPAPKKQRRKPMKRAKRRIVVQTAPKPAKKPRKKRRKVRVARKSALPITKDVSHAEFTAAWDIAAKLVHFDTEAKTRILEKIREVWS